MIGLFARKSVMEDYHTIRLFYPHIPVIYIGDKKYLDTEDISRFEDFIEVFDTPETINSIIETALACNDDGHQYRPVFGGRTLVIEGSHIDGLLMQIHLENLGMSVDVIAMGNEMMSSIKGKAYDLVFIDMHVIEFQGQAILKEVIDLEAQKDVPVIAITDDALKDTRAKYTHLGMTDYISRPISEPHLLGILRKYLVPQIHGYELVQEGEHDTSSQTKHEEIALIPYDLDSVAKEAGIDKVTLEMLLDNFFLGFNGEMERLEQALKSNDADAAIEIARFIKLESEGLQFESGVQMLDAIIHHGENGSLESIELTKLLLYFEGIKKRLEEFRVYI